MTESIIQEPCPKCEAMHIMGEYLTWPDDKDRPRNKESGADGTEEGYCTTASPPDIKCQCGLELRFRVPSGYVLGVLRDSEHFKHVGQGVM